MTTDPPTTDQAEVDRWHMVRALELAALGEGHVEPNPMVGCVIARAAEIVGQGYHRWFGGPHAEIEALRVGHRRSAGATMYVTLEPCCHHGKTPPCTEAILQAKIARVVVALQDPFPQVAGGGIAQLREAGVRVDVGILEDQAAALCAPYLKLNRTGRPWVIAKWAMTLDGKIASRAGSSRWISGAESRQRVHALRSRVDAIVVGRGTVQADDPLLTARTGEAPKSDDAPPPRTLTRIVVDLHATLSPQSRLVQSADQAPVLIAVGLDAPVDRTQSLTAAGCEVFPCQGDTHLSRFESLLDELGRRRMTNVLVEGGSQLLGSLFDGRLIDECHAFIAPKLIGGLEAPSPLAGEGIAEMTDAIDLTDPVIETVGGDIYIHGRVK